MSHLSPAVLVDLLDGTVPEAAVPHLGSCPGCRQQLLDLRAAWQAAAAADVPEPSPLFWDYLSARIRTAVAADPVVRPQWRFAASWRGVALAGAVIAAVAMTLVLRTPAPVTMPDRQGGDVRAAVMEDVLPDPLIDDESMRFVVDLASNVDWEAGADVGLAASGDADRALADTSVEERRELQRLLTAALRKGV